MRTFLLGTFLSSLGFLSFSQSNPSIEGQVLDENQIPIPFANVALYTQADSSLISGAVSDDNGNFKITVAPGKYFLKITFLSYQEKIISPIDLSNRHISLGNLILKPNTNLLDAVVVEGEQSQMELFLDKRIFTVGKDLSNISSNASDILDNVPSVTVDVEGNVSLRGSQNVRILIDGKPSGLTGISTANALKQLQGNLIESIEVITNPSARYDAEGEVGIINIILKKEKQKGINGSFSLNVGYPKNIGGSYSINFRKKRLNFFSSYGYSFRDGPGGGSSQEKLFGEPQIAYDQSRDRNRNDKGHNVRFGIDYFFSTSSTLTGSVIVRQSNGLNTQTNYFAYYNDDTIIDSTIVRKEIEKEPEVNTEVALSYQKEFSKKGKTLSADFKWIENRETEKAHFVETNDFQGSTLYQRSINTENERNVLLQADYIHPIGRKGKFEGGIKTTHRIIPNLFQVEEQNAEEQWILDPNYNSDFKYTENIYATYLMIGNELTPKFSWQGGLRGEITDITIAFTNPTASINNQYYTNLFPSAHLSYKLEEHRTFQLSYSYRLSRPRYRDLLPYSGFSNNRVLFVGNPNLRPEFTHSIEAGYLLTGNKGSLLSSVYYRYRTGVRERIRIQSNLDSTQILLIPVNLSKENAYGVEINYSLDPIDWFRLNTNINFYRAISEGRYKEQELFSDTYAWTTRTTARFVIKKWVDIQASLDYRSPRIYPQGKYLAYYTLDLGLSRDLLKGNGTIMAGVQDLFNSRKWRWVTETETSYSKGNFQWRQRQFMITFNYRLNRTKERHKSDLEGTDGGGTEF